VSGANPTAVWYAGTLSNFTFKTSAVTSKAWTVTVFKNGAATAITCTVASGAQTCSDSTHSVAFAVTDQIQVQVTYSGNGGGGFSAWSGTYQ
jgi:hypothetical protein